MADIQPEINAFKSAVYGEEVRDAMVSLANKLNTENTSNAEAVRNLLNYNALTFTVTGGTGHSSTKDQMEFSVSEGESFKVNIVKEAACNIQIWAYGDGTGSTIGTYNGSTSGVDVALVAPYDVKKLGLYVVSESTQNISFLAKKTGSVLDYESLIDSKLGPYRYEDFIVQEYSANVLGNLADVLYPIPPLRNGTKVIFYTTDGEDLATKTKMQFYDKDGLLITYRDFRLSDGKQRIFTYDGSDTAYYISKSVANSPVGVSIAVDERPDNMTYAEGSQTRSFRVSDMVDSWCKEKEVLVTAGAYHSNTKHRMPINISEGSTFHVRLIDPNGIGFTSYNLWGDRDYGGMNVNEVVEVTALADITSLGVYLPAAPSSGSVYLQVFTNRSPFIGMDDVDVDASYDFVSSARVVADNAETAMQAYAEAMVGLTDTEQFLFFTDPHIFQHSVNESGMRRAIGAIEYVYNSTPTSFVLCGGDWLQSSDTAAEAAYKLGRIDGIMRGKFGDRYYPILGNHDTNYQGASYVDSKTYEDRISNEALIQLWFREYGNAYYDFVGPSGTRFYVFDSQIDWSQSMNAYFWEQCDWYATNLIENDDIHSVIAIHIIKISDNIQQFPTNLSLIAAAYNAREVLNLNNKTYDFSGCKGNVAFMIGGHIHNDDNGVINGIPWITSINSGYMSSFDLCIIDYSNSKLIMKRVGSGADRAIDIVS